jgi:hypothetical protein
VMPEYALREPLSYSFLLKQVTYAASLLEIIQIYICNNKCY